LYNIIPIAIPLVIVDFDLNGYKCRRESVSERERLKTLVVQVGDDTCNDGRQNDKTAFRHYHPTGRMMCLLEMLLVNFYYPS